MEFDGDIGLIQRNVANVPEGEARRNVVFDALAPMPGQAILDIGCDGGHLVKSIGKAVGDKGCYSSYGSCAIRQFGDVQLNFTL